jgi:hypothetical protein
MELVVKSTGDATCVYSEAIDLGVLGNVSIRRGSHVEPTPDGRWTADMSPVNGPILGPFAHRSDALDAEVCWLHKHWLPGG